MNIFKVLIPIVLIISGCTTKIDNQIYDKPIRSTISMEDGKLRFYFLNTKGKSVFYEPCTGLSTIEIMALSRRSITFKILTTNGIPWNLETLEKSDRETELGKVYKAEIESGKIIKTKLLKTL